MQHSTMSLSNSNSPSLPTLFLSFLFLFFLFPSPTISFDISKILSQYPSFSTFSNYLAQTQLAQDINNRQTITVLAVDNSGISPLSGKPMDVIKNVLSLHVILDYYDVQKLQNLNDKSAILTTLFQASGQASGQSGFLKVTDTDSGAVSFASAADQSGNVGSSLVKSVASEPYNLSVVQISTIIMPSALLASSPQSSSPSPSPSPASSQVPAPSPVPATSTAPAPASSQVPAASPVPAKSPVPAASPSPVPAKSPAPVASSPGSVKSPAPMKSPVPSSSPLSAASPGPVESEGPVGSPVGAAPDNTAADGGDSKSGVAGISGVSMVWITVITLLWAMYLQ